MKELKTDQTPPIYQIHPRANKRWTIAQHRPEKQLKMQNENVELAYHRVINFVKSLHLKPNEVYFEKDYKRDRADLFSMHSIVTPTFYWRLECSLLYTYDIEFAFGNCPFEADIRHMLKAYPLDRAAKEKALKPDYNTFYEVVLQVQDSKFIGTLLSPPIADGAASRAT